MEDSLRGENKALLKVLIDDFDRPFKYAERVVRRLAKGKVGRKTVPVVKVTKAMVYQNVSGNSYSPEIAHTIILLARAKRISDVRINKQLKRLTN